jgi:vancomycin resistance protein YoaR
MTSEPMASTEESPRPRRFRASARRVSLAVVGALLIVVLCFGLDRARARGKVLRGVQAGGVPLGGLDRANLERAVGELSERLRRDPLTVRCGEQSFTIAPADVVLEIDTARSVEVALGAGRSNNVARDFGWWVARWFSRNDVTPAGRLDRSRLVKLVSEWDDKLTNRPFAGAIRVSGGHAVADYPRSGFLLDRATVEARVLGGFLREPRAAVPLDLRPVDPPLDRPKIEEARNRAERLVGGAAELKSETSSASLRLEARDLALALRSRVTTEPALELFFDTAAVEPKLGELRRLEHEPRDARFQVSEKDEVSIVPAEAGLKLDPAAVSRALLAAAASPSRAGELPWDRSAMPALTTEAAEALHITRLVSQFTTHHACCQPRVGNIHHIADILDGRVVKPGETFSINQVVGPRTRANGFVPAPTIEEGEMVDTPGGGISQFATTFFNAVFHGGYDILERQPHTYYFARYPMGHEATLSYPKPDLVFRNDTDAGVLIRCEYGDTFIRVKIFGDNGGRKVTAKVNGQFDIKRPPVELFPNRKLSSNREKVRYGGTVGWSVMVSRLITFPDGTRREEKRKVTYNPRPREVEVHPCRIPKDEPGYTGEECPVPKDTGEDDEQERRPE